MFYVYMCLYSLRSLLHSPRVCIVFWGITVSDPCQGHENGLSLQSCLDSGHHGCMLDNGLAQCFCDCGYTNTAYGCEGNGR